MPTMSSRYVVLSQRSHEEGLSIWFITERNNQQQLGELGALIENALDSRGFHLDTLGTVSESTAQEMEAVEIGKDSRVYIVNGVITAPISLESLIMDGLKETEQPKETSRAPIPIPRAARWKRRRSRK